MTMTLESAIKHCEEVADEKEKEGKLLCQSESASVGCLTCAEEHMQLAEWLRDYKRLLEKEPTGHWVGIDEEPHEDYECDRCGFIHTFIDGHMAQYNYCPSCGADMRGESNDGM